MVEHKHLTTNDGVRLHYAAAGPENAQQVVFVHGWAQSADSFRFQLEGLGDRYRMIALDLRGHGESEKPPFGNSMFRFAKDLHDLLVELDLNDIVLVGHSMGCAVLWGYWTLFRDERLKKLVLIDEMASVSANPIWTDEQKVQKGPIYDQETLYATYAAMMGPDGEAASAGSVGPLFTAECAPEILEQALVESAKSPVKLSAQIFLNHCLIDWIEEIETTNLPTLVVNGEDSHVPPPSTEWIAETIPGAELVTFTMPERAEHFMFLENPTRFNQVLADFIEQRSAELA